MISRLTAYAVTTAAFAALLSACGGGGGSNAGGQPYSVSVDVSGLSGSLALQLTPGDTALTVTADGLTAFSTTVTSGGTYGVTITTQPAGQYCTLVNNAGTVSADVTVSVTCNTSLGGIWKATVGSAQYFEIADEMGDFYVLAATPSVGFGAALSELDVGTATVSNNAVTGTYLGADPSGTFADGSSAGSGSLTGTIVSGTSLDLTTTFTTTDSTVYTQTPDYAYDSLYQSPSALTTIAGNYTDSQNDGFSITDSGVIYLQSPGTGCVENGQISVIDGRYDVYDITFTYSNCSGTGYTYLNGITFSGIVTLDTEPTAALIIGGATAELSDGGDLVVPLLLQRN